MDLQVDSCVEEFLFWGVKLEEARYYLTVITRTGLIPECSHSNEVV